MRSAPPSASIPRGLCRGNQKTCRMWRHPILAPRGFEHLAVGVDLRLKVSSRARARRSVRKSTVTWAAESELEGLRGAGQRLSSKDSRCWNHRGRPQSPTFPGGRGKGFRGSRTGERIEWAGCARTALTRSLVCAECPAPHCTWSPPRWRCPVRRGSGPVPCRWWSCSGNAQRINSPLRIFSNACQNSTRTTTAITSRAVNVMTMTRVHLLFMGRALMLWLRQVSPDCRMGPSHNITLRSHPL